MAAPKWIYTPCNRDCHSCRRRIAVNGRHLANRDPVAGAGRRRPGTRLEDIARFGIRADIMNFKPVGRVSDMAGGADLQQPNRDTVIMTQTAMVQMGVVPVNAEGVCRTDAFKIPPR